MSKQAFPPQAAVSDITETILAAHLRVGGGFCISIEDGGKLLGLGKTKTYEMVASGELPTVTIGGKRCFSIRQLLAYLEGREAQSRWRQGA
jgi:excisionase family DNA binding protein